jgi:hypothetical protein
VSTHHDRAPGAGVREQIGVALLRKAVEQAEDRRATLRRIAAVPAGVPGRDRALGALWFAGWVDAVLLWVGWRLLPGHALSDQASPPAA